MSSKTAVVPTNEDLHKQDVAHLSEKSITELLYLQELIIEVLGTKYRKLRDAASGGYYSDRNS